MLNLDGNRRIGTLEVRAGDQYPVDVARLALCLLERLARRRERDLAKERRLVVRAPADAWPHHVGIEDALLVDDMTAANPRRLDHELAARLPERLCSARVAFGRRLPVPTAGG